METTEKTTQAEREKLMAEDDKAESKPSLRDALQKLGAIAPDKAEEDERQLAILREGLSESIGLEQVLLSDLVESPFNTRKRWGDMSELTASILKAGRVVVPIIGRRVGKQVQIVAGHRRFRGAKQAGLETVPVDFRDWNDLQVFEAQAIENVQRQDLHPMEEAEHYELMKKAGYTPETVAAKVGKSAGWVHGRIKLLSLGAECRTAFGEGVIPVSVALPLARIPRHDLQAKCLHDITRGPMTARDQIEYIQKEFCRHLKGAPFDLKDETLVPEVGSCSACPRNSNNMPVTLFGDYEGSIERQGVCTDTPCHAVKAKAIYERQAEKAKATGATVLSAAQASRVIKDGKLTYGAPFVKADAIVQNDPKKRTWEQLLGKLEADHRPGLTVAPNDLEPGRMMKLFGVKEAEKAVKELGLKWARSEAPDPKPTTPAKSPEAKKAASAQREKEKEAALKGTLVLKLTRLTIPRLVERWSSKAGLPELRALATELFAKRNILQVEDEEAAFVGFKIPGAKDGKVPTERAIETWIEKTAEREELIAFSLVVACYEKWTNTGEDFEESFAELATAAGANLKEGLRAQQVEAAMASKKKGKGK